MPVIDSWALIGTMLGLAASAGVNLYLTTLVVGLSIRLGWLAHFPPELGLLGADWVLGVTGALYAVEFFADKVPWVDSLWDTVHTLIRPVGGAFLAIRTLGDTPPALDLVAALAAGGVAFSTHSTKASTRLLANHSPEPFSNIALSLVEDAAVLGLSWLSLHHPLLALLLVVTFLVAFVFIAPKVFRMLRAQITFVIGRVRSFFTKPTSELFANHEQALATLPPRLSLHVSGLLAPGERIAFAIPCFSGRMRAIGRSVSGVLIGSDATRLWFVGRRTLRTVSKPIEFQGRAVELRRRLLVDEILIQTGSDGSITVRFDKTRGHLALQVTQLLAQRGALVDQRTGRLLAADAPAYNTA